MRQNELNKKLFEQNKYQWLDADTCLPFESWDDFIEEKPDIYGDIEHKRTKLFNPIPKYLNINIKKFRE